MNNKTIIMSVLAVVIIGGALFFANQSQQSNQTAPVQNNTVEPQATTVPTTGSSTESGAMEEANSKTVTVDGSNFSFSLKEIKVKKGTKVTVVFKNKDGMHDFVLDEFNVKTKQIKSGEEETISFVADKVGTFEYYCSVGKHRAMGMKGNLIVE